MWSVEDDNERERVRDNEGKTLHLNDRCLILDLVKKFRCNIRYMHSDDQVEDAESLDDMVKKYVASLIHPVVSE